MTPQRAIRLALGWLALVAVQIGVWALLAPRSFYDDFPGFGRTWVSVDGPFNEHLVRDVGALNLGVGALLIYAIARPTRELVSVAAVVSLVWGIPHLLYHIANASDLAGIDVVASLGGLAVGVLLPVLLLKNARHLAPAPTAAHAQVSR